MLFFESRLPCDATQVGRFRRALGEAGVEELLAKTIETAVATKAIALSSFERVIVDTTVQEKAIERAVRIQTQKRADKNKLYAFHAPEVECISKGKAKTPYEFGVKVSIAVTHIWHGTCASG